MRYSDVESFLRAKLPNGTIIDPGPLNAISVRKQGSSSLVIATVGGGGGLASEGNFDRPFIIVRTIGPQQDYTAAETLAFTIDEAFLTLDHNSTVGNAKVLYVTRTGAGPTLIDFDSITRYHFQCTYIAETKV